MSDDSEVPWFAPGHHRVGIPRERRRGTQAWRLRNGEQTITCELLNDMEMGGGRRCDRPEER